MAGLTGGSTVYIRVWPNGNLSNMGTFNICAYEPIPPNNNLPCGAVTLDASSPTCSPTNQDTDNMTPTSLTGLTVPNPSCDATGPYNDVWFAVTVPATGAMTINTIAGTLTDAGMAWYRLSGGADICPPGYSGTMTEIACNGNQSGTNLMPRINSLTTAIVPPLVVGETIYVRIWNQNPTGDGFGTFSICATGNQPPPNDNPCGAIPLATSLTCNLTGSTTGGATTTVGMTPSCGAPVQNDVWYAVTIPPGGEVQVQTQGDEMTDAAMAIYSAPSCAGPFTQLACAVGGSSFGAAMPALTVTGTVGDVVYVQVWRQTGNIGTFNICARQTVSSATITGCDEVFYDSGGPIGSYGPNENIQQTFCPATPGDVVSLAFTSFNTQANFDIMTIYNGPSPSSPVLGSYSGGSLPPGFTSTAVGGCITIVFTSNGSVNASGWAVNVSCGPPLPQIPPPNGVCGTTVYDSGGATGQYLNNEIYTQTYCPTIPGQFVTLTFNFFQIEQGWDFLTVFNGPSTASPAMGTFTGNVNPGTFVSTDPSGCLTIRFTSDFSIVQAGWAATVRCGPQQTPPIPPPAGGGACGQTFYDPGGPSANYQNAVNQTPGNFGGNNCWPYTCLGGGLTNPPGQPLWSQTHCPPNGPGTGVVSITFTTFSLEFGWDNMYVYSGQTVSPNNANGFQFLSGNGAPTCGGPAGWCNNTLGAGGYTGNVNPGTFTSQSPDGCITVSMTSDDIVTNPGFSYVVNCTSSIVGSGCTYALRMYDSFGDGWAGSYLTVTIDPVAPGPIGTTTYTIQSGNFNQVNLSLSVGDIVTITYYGGGYFPGDNHWTLDLVGSPYSEYHSAVPAVNGSSYSFTADCIPPPPALTDCPGAINVCASTTSTSTNIVQSADNFGSVGDLWPANFGCLSGTERRGTWSILSSETAGQIAFTLTPTPAGTNLDYGVWGPFPPTTTMGTICMPTTPPIRCSTAGASSQPGGATGIGPPAAPNYALSSVTYNDITVGYTPGITVGTPGEIYLLYVSNAINSGPTAITWTGTTGTMDCNILPVELLNFDALPGERHVDVIWSTASEQNSAWFDVQRSGEDGNSYVTIGRVSAAGASLNLIDYAFVDHSPLEGLSYYRLYQVDTDGNGTYSHAVPVVFRRNQGSLQVFPNPATDLLNVVYELPNDEDVHWRLTDASGRLVRTGNRGSEKGSNRLVIDLNSVEPGSYMIDMRDRSGKTLGVARFVKH